MLMSMGSSHTTTPICHKCGYDQAGEIAAWENQCPLHGRCPECGLEFAWADLLDPSRVDIDWYIEHAKGPWGLIKRTLPTLWWLLIPNRFWKRVGVNTRIRLRMLMLWWVMLFGVFHLMTTLALVIGAVASEWVGFNQWGVIPKSQQVSFLEYARGQDAPFWVRNLWGCVSHPFHYSVSYISETAEGSVGAVHVAGGFCVLWAIVMGVVPTTRRLVKLRIAHIWRALFLSLVLVSFAYQLGRMFDAATLISMYILKSRAMYSGGGFIFMALMMLMFLWTQWFWIAAIRIGWGVRSSWALIVLGTIASLLGGLVTVLVIDLYL